jgi:hypothetical protein
MTERTEARLERLALKVANAIMDSPRFRQTLREVVLAVHVCREEQAKLAATRAFFNAARDAGLRVYLKDGTLRTYPRERLTPELKAVLILYRESIVAWLEQRRHLEERVGQALSVAGLNGHAKRT